MNISYKLIANPEDLKAAYAIRTQVFVEEQGVPAENEIDEFEEIAKHVLVLYDNQPAATGRLRNVNGIAKLERICVLASHRSFGLGKAVVEALEAVARDEGLTNAKLNAQTHAEKFYEKLGYRTQSDIFLEEDIPHITMTKTLS